jgi:hypothetical protein
MKNKFKITLKLNDADYTRLMDASKDSDIKSIKVKIEASHSGIVNANNFFYTPHGMKSGVKSFVEPYSKPVMVAHDSNADAVGRVLKAKYIDYPEIVADVKDVKDPVDGVDAILDFVKKNKDFKKKGYKGLGHVELVAEITDSEAIEKVMDKRYLTVSIGGGVDKAVCSICGTDKMTQDDSTDYEDRCNHWRGETYDGEKAFLIGGKMEFNEVSYVNTPADKNAVSEVINDEANQEIFSNGKFEILDFEVEEKKGVNKLKKKLKDILSDKSIVSDTLKALGLNSFALEDEQYGKLRKTSYLFANDKAVPVNDKAHIIAAYEILSDAEDSKDLDEAREVLDRKFANLFGKDISIEDAKKELLDSVKTDEDVSDSTDTDDVGIDYDKLADSVAAKVTVAVVDQLKDSFTVNDSFLGQRNEILEAEVAGLEKEIDALTDKYKSAMINQILNKEDKLEDATYRGKLESRTLDSLNDKLEDLGLAAKQEEDTSKEETITDESDKDKVTDTSVNIEDASDDSGELSDEDGSVEDNVEDSADDVLLDIDVVKSEYKNIFKKQGFSAARKYLKDLEDAKKLPDNFTFA